MKLNQPLSCCVLMNLLSVSEERMAGITTGFHELRHFAFACRTWFYKDFRTYSFGTYLFAKPHPSSLHAEVEIISVLCTASFMP
jgi:hypothetical protein